MTSIGIGQPEVPAVEAIRRKVVRAYDQARVLADAETAYVDAEPSPYRVRRAIKTDFTEHVYYLQLDVPIPLDFSILLGEIVYNLRSALDQCIFQLALDRTGVEKDTTMFPVFSSPGEYRRKGAWRIKFIGDGPRTLIESLQPYPNRSLPIHYSLFDLNNLANADKHRAVHLWGLSFVFGEMEVATGARVDPTGFGEVLYDGAEIFRVFPETPTNEMQVRRSVRAAVSIKNPTAAGRGVSTNLWDLIADVRTLVNSLLDALGAQNDPIVIGWPLHGSNAPRHCLTRQAGV